MKGERAKWPLKTKSLMKDLHKELVISNYDWHELKALPERRVAELLISALSQLINNGELTDVEDLINQALKWIKKEVKDPGCPNH
tara:strand:+ start:322 stop:576 length:255 start_codon:yes stop_codon:yes gene_type:complete